MRWLFVLTALIGGLVPALARGDDDQRVSLVQTVIGITVTDGAGQPLVTPDSAVAVVWDQFGNKPWPAEHWAILILKSGPVGSLVPTRIPLNKSGMRYLGWYAKVFRKPRIKLGFTVQDAQRQPVRITTGIRIVIWQLGPDPWPEELWVSVIGDLDAEGHIVVPVNFPLTGIVVKNLKALAKTQTVR